MSFTVPKPPQFKAGDILHSVREESSGFSMITVTLQGPSDRYQCDSTWQALATDGRMLTICPDRDWFATPREAIADVDEVIDSEEEDYASQMESLREDIRSLHQRRFSTAKVGRSPSRGIRTGRMMDEFPTQLERYIGSDDPAHAQIAEIRKRYCGNSTMDPPTRELIRQEFRKLIDDYNQRTGDVLGMVDVFMCLEPRPHERVVAFKLRPDTLDNIPIELVL